MPALAKGRERKPQRITANALEVALAFGIAATDVGIVPTAELIGVLLAQSALETGNWSVMYNFNFGNVKATDGWIAGGGDYTFYDYAAPRGRTHSAPVSENLSLAARNHALKLSKPRTDGVDAPDMFVVSQRKNGEWYCLFWPSHIQTRFRAFDTLEAGALGYLSKLTGKYASALEFAARGDVRGYVSTIRQIGYFTAPLEGYVHTVQSLYNKYLPVAEKAMPNEFSELSETGVFRTEPAHAEMHESGLFQLKSGAKITKLPIWDTEFDLAARMGFGPAADWLRERGMRLPTVPEEDELHLASLFVKPYTMPTVEMLKAAGVPSSQDAINSYRNAHMMSHRWCAMHDSAVFTMLKAAGYDGSQPVANFGKHWVLPTGTIYGWWTGTSKTAKIQGPSKFHAGNPDYADYATNYYGVIDAEPAEYDTVELADDDRPELRKGMAGQWVKVWQERLIHFGFSLEPYGADKDFGNLTEKRTEELQGLISLPKSGAVDAQLWAKTDELEIIQLPEVTIHGWVPEKDVGGATQRRQAPRGQARQDAFGPLKFVAAPTRGNPEAIRITNDFASRVVPVTIPQLGKIPGVNGQGRGPRAGTVMVHELAAEAMVDLWQAWEDAGLLPLVKTWAGMWNPRFIRGSRVTLSNHAFATAFDINAPWNWLGQIPAAVGKTGSVRPLVALAEQHGWAWGGHFKSRKDAMHFELAKT